MGTDAHKQPVLQQPQIPYDIDFQNSLIRLLCEDDGFAHAISSHLNPMHFTSEPLSWAIAYCIRHREQYGGFPTLRVLREQVGAIDPKLQPMYAAAVGQMANASLADEQWLRDQTLDFVKRNIFVRTFQESKALYNGGKVVEAYDLMMDRMEQLTKTAWEPADRTWYFDDLPRRQNARMQSDPWDYAISTGQAWLDDVLDGGLSHGELGIWIGYAKTGKSILLVNMGVASAKQLRNTAHFVFEGSLGQTANRYDAAFLDEFYGTIKRGDVDSAKYAAAWQDFQNMKHKLVIRAFTERWDYSVVDVHEELKSLKRNEGWEPECVVVDYGDLLSGRDKFYRSETDKQKAAFRDLKSLANRGYAVWTASQAQRPQAGAEDRAHWIYSRMIADCYEKVRVADFLGTINATRLEKQQNVMRIMAELYRDNDAGRRMVVRCEYGKMTIREEAGLVSPSMPDLEAQPSLGYITQQGQPQQGPKQTGFM